MNKLPDWLKAEINKISSEVFTKDIERLEKENQGNCLALVKKLGTFSKKELIILLWKEVQREYPRSFVLDKVHARLCKLIRLEQRGELLACLKKS